MRHLPLLLARSVLFSGRPGPLSWSGAGGFGGGDAATAGCWHLEHGQLVEDPQPMR
jgi:hypothetical protein